MNKVILLTLCLLLICTAASAQVLPDAAASLDVSVQQHMTDYQYSADFICDVWVYPRDSRTDSRMAEWIMASLKQGYTVSCITLEGQNAFRLEHNGLYALMFPKYQGAVMLMVQKGLDYAPAMATPTPRPTAQPTAQPATPNTSSPSGWEWVWVEVEKDCPSCYGGSCSICNGTGVYRLYGEEVWCRIYCSSCDGRGTYTTREYQYIRVN